MKNEILRTFRTTLEKLGVVKLPNSYFPEWRDHFPLPKAVFNNKFLNWAHSLDQKSRERLQDDIDNWHREELGLKPLEPRDQPEDLAFLEFMRNFDFDDLSAFIDIFTQGQGIESTESTSTNEGHIIPFRPRSKHTPPR